jgi:hypothetical protein
VGKLQLEEVGVLIKSRMESDVIPQIVGPIPNINVASILDLAWIQPIISLEDMVYPETHYGWKHITLTPFGVSHCITFQGCACLNVSHLKLLKDFHNSFAYYVRI